MRLKTIGYTLMVWGAAFNGAMAVEGTQPYEAYLNRIKTLSGQFTQVNSKGQKAMGQIQMARPGKMRLEYNPPSPLLIVADGKWLITKDREADEVNYSSLDKTPAAFILRPQVRFSGDVEVTNVVPKGDTTEISLIRKEDPDAGYITLVFEDNPIALKEWSVIDGQGIQTRVILSDLRENVALPSGIFAIESPNLIQRIF
jgi:outer membrane lipoprotein-sorting protein